MTNQNVKDFMDGTPKKWHLEITEGCNENVVYSGSYADMPEKYNNKLVTSWDATPMADGTTDVGIMI